MRTRQSPGGTRTARDWCQANGLPNLVIANAQLAVTEAAAKAVRHSGCIDFQIQGRMSATTLIVVVSDQGPGRSYPDPGGGLGTGIIRELAAVVAFRGHEPRHARHDAVFHDARSCSSATRVSTSTC